jgi:hypothetical protein
MVETLLPLMMVGLAGVTALLLAHSLWSVALLHELRGRVDTLTGLLEDDGQVEPASPLAAPRSSPLTPRSQVGEPLLVAEERLVSLRRAHSLRLYAAAAEGTEGPGAAPSEWGARQARCHVVEAPARAADSARW